MEGQQLWTELTLAREKIKRLESYCRDYAEMTDITLNVSDEQREKFIAALDLI
jgi:hypothetical protein